MRIFVERPIATAMILLALLVLGVYSFLHIPIEMPVLKEGFPQLDINTSWYGMPPEIMFRSRRPSRQNLFENV